MCGIFCIIEHNAEVSQLDKYFTDVEQLLHHRGPDFQKKHSLSISRTTTLHIMGTTLHLRGVLPVVQPLLSDSGNFLIWNGEIFNGIEVEEDGNDTQILFDLLQKCANPLEIVSVMIKIHGPYAFIYWQGNHQKLWFGRDFFGRRSLLWKFNDSPVQNFALSSVASRPTMLPSTVENSYQDWSEVPGDGIYYLDLSQETSNIAQSVYLYSWRHLGEPESVTKILKPKCQWPISDMKVAVTEMNSRLPTEDDLNLFSRALHFMEPLTANHMPNNLKHAFDLMCTITDFQNAMHQLEVVLQDAVKKRVKNQPNKCQQCIQHVIHSKNGESPIYDTQCHHSKIAVLFSGGLDSTILSVLVDRCLPSEEPIDLLNVAFEQQVNRHACTYDVPDRVSGKEAFKELQLLAPERRWNFVEINVSKEELKKQSEDRISDLVYPLSTVLDNDIGCAVWFATRGCGTVTNCQHEKYISPARVVLTGMGADEQFAGYSRHRVCFLQGGWRGLLEELKMEMRRISSRNLGRDDRVISDHGREARFPFLDEDVVAYLNTVPIWYKANLSFPRGIGDKFILRMIAYKIGLRKPAVLAKRAIQFGSRIAKMEKSRKGSDICVKLTIKQV